VRELDADLPLTRVPFPPLFQGSFDFSPPPTEIRKLDLFSESYPSASPSLSSFSFFFPFQYEAAPFNTRTLLLVAWFPPFPPCISFFSPGRKRVPRNPFFVPSLLELSDVSLPLGHLPIMSKPHFPLFSLFSLMVNPHRGPPLFPSFFVSFRGFSYRMMPFPILRRILFLVCLESFFCILSYPFFHSLPPLLPLHFQVRILCNLLHCGDIAPSLFDLEPPPQKTLSSPILPYSLLSLRWHLGYTSFFPPPPPPPFTVIAQSSNADFPNPIDQTSGNSFPPGPFPACCPVGRSPL